MSELPQKNIRDMQYDLNERLKTIMDEIDVLKANLPENPLLIIKLNERIHSLFINLIRKITEEQEIKKQWDYYNDLTKLNPIIFVYVSPQGYPTSPRRDVNGEEYIKFLTILQEREIHLYCLIEKLGIKRRVVG